MKVFGLVTSVVLTAAIAGACSPQAMEIQQFDRMAVENMTIGDLAKRLKREPAELVKKLFLMGIMTTQNQSLDADTIELLLLDYGVTPEKKVEEGKTDIERL